MVLFGEVGEMEVARECPGNRRCTRQRPRRDQLLCLAFVRRVIPGSDHRTPQELDVSKQRGAAIFGDDLPEDLAQHADVTPELRRYLQAGGVPPGQDLRLGLASCAYSNESTSAARDASMMLLEQPTVVQRRNPRPDSMSTLVVAAVPAALSRMRTL